LDDRLRSELALVLAAAETDVGRSAAYSAAIVLPNSSLIVRILSATVWSH
jgi:hypothetical protein